MSLIIFFMSLGSMSHVDFKKGPCRPSDRVRAARCEFSHIKLKLNAHNFQDKCANFASIICSMVNK